MRVTRIILCASIVIAIPAVYLVARAAVDPYGMQLRSLTPELDPARPATSPYSDAYHRDNARLYNDLGRQSSWDADDTAFIRDIILSSWPDIPKPTEVPDMEGLFLFDAAMAIVELRLQVGVETDPTIIEAYHSVAHDLLDHPRGYMRGRGVTNVADAGMDADERAVIERMAAEDPDEDVRRVAQLKLDQADNVPGADADCPTCPKGGNP